MQKQHTERTAMLLGAPATERLSRAHVAVFGLGGVGGHAVEALVRSGIGELTLIDADRVAESNLNRQLIATLSTVGMLKTDAMAERVRDISPETVLHLCPKFVLPENLGEFDFSSFDYVVDAIDTTSAKIDIVRRCTEAGVPVISSMGAGNKLDPTRFEVADIYSTSVCPLASVMRRELKKLGIPSLKVVYSREERVKPAFQPENADTRKATPASCAFVPSVVGLIIAGEVVRDLARNEIRESLSGRK